MDYKMNPKSNGSTNLYRFLFYELADPRTNSWFLISDPGPPLAILSMYLYFVLNWGPRLMKNRQPYELKTVLVVYNFLQVLLSTWLVVEGLDILNTIKFSWVCQPVDFSNSPIALRIIRGVYIYFLAKMTELLDTVFFVLRKKDRQITFLHVYHHTAMPMISWGATKYFPGGHGAIVGLINSFVHIVMYSYYMMAAMGPRYQRFLWWKKYITTLQMAQFGLAFLHNSQLLFVDCGYPRWSVVFTLPNAIFFYVLFSDFYQKNYSGEKKIRYGEKMEHASAEKCSYSEVKEATSGYSTGGLGISDKKML
ncbi:unnamed protein product [Phaedon cochleariae]|uniref:Elongation of very long chain fatty acids protein n=1 Tax=Phaedon cochleariae TaxID=80249 RepID=A0A9P0GPA9_PHACE|nr:unnamed protein product [Phaedon cochleariae]